MKYEWYDFGNGFVAAFFDSKEVDGHWTWFIDESLVIFGKPGKRDWMLRSGDPGRPCYRGKMGVKKWIGIAKGKAKSHIDDKNTFVKMKNEYDNLEKTLIDAGNEIASMPSDMEMPSKERWASESRESRIAMSIAKKFFK